MGGRALTVSLYPAPCSGAVPAGKRSRVFPGAGDGQRLRQRVSIREFWRKVVGPWALFWLNCVPLKFICWSSLMLRYLGIGLLQMWLRWSHTRVGWALNITWLGSIKKGKIWPKTHTQEHDNVKMKAGIYKTRHAWDCHTTEGKGKAQSRFPLLALRRKQPCWHLGLTCLASRTVGQ